MTDDPSMAERLAALRAELAGRGLDGFVVPRADEHQGEYVAASAQRLAWLTGFTGSAGIAVVLAEKAALFTDGRYTLQAAREVDADRFEHHHVSEYPPARWVGEALPRGARLGYDPWLHLAEQVRGLAAACEKAGGELVAVESNPLDAVWSDRPAPPLGPVVAHPLEFAGRSAADKRAELATALAEDRCDAAVLADPASVAWLLNIRGADVDYAPLPLAFAILHADAGVELFLDGRKLSAPTLDHLGSQVTIRPPAALADALTALGQAAKRVRVDAGGAPAAIATALERAGARVDAGADPCALPKACKNPVELDGMRAAHRRDGAALARFLAWLAGATDVDELSAAAALEQFRAAGEHYRGPSFPTIAGAAGNGAIVHYRSGPETCRRLESGTLFLVDSGGQYLDGTTDVTRTVAIGPAGDEERHRFTLVLKGHIAVAAALFPVGTTGGQLDTLARRFLWAEGLDFDHGTGHGVGSYLSVHEGPQRISKQGNPVALKPGMVLSIEPGYYKTGAYGIRLENLAAVVAAPATGERSLLGFEPLTLAPFDRNLIDVALLDAAERAWLDSYHARVAAEITPQVDAATAAWLAEAARPLG